MVAAEKIRVDFGGIGRHGDWLTVNLDTQLRMPPNVVANITAHAGQLDEHFPINHIDEARCIHTLEHLPAWDILPTLYYWRKFMKRNAKLLIVVPDLGKLARDYAMGLIPMEVLAAVAYVPASRTKPGPLEEHRWGWDAQTLSDTLLRAGYRAIRAGTDEEWPASWTLDFEECEPTGLVGKYQVPNLRMVGHA